jgi:uncharacterized protein Smg (DUF494 family)
MDIYERLSANPALLESNDDLFPDLVQNGHSIDEVNRAFTVAADSIRQQPCERCVRYLSPDEKRLLLPEAYGFLMNLQLTGLIDSKIIELILMRAMLLQTYPLTLDEVHEVIDYFIMNPQYTAQQRTFDILTYEAPDGEIN